MSRDLLTRVPVAVEESITYSDFRERLRQSHCARCPELSAHRTQIVVDRGNERASVLVVGEAPGDNEDREGRAFVGRSGKLLDSAMASVGLSTDDDMLIVNVVKCRPPHNRPPRPVEAAQCRSYLLWQLKHVNPRVIVLLGATAARHLLPGKTQPSMKDRVGRLFDSPEYPVAKLMLLYHPAYILRDPRKKPDMWAHVNILKEYLVKEGLYASH